MSRFFYDRPGKEHTMLHTRVRVAGEGIPSIAVAQNNGTCKATIVSQTPMEALVGATLIAADGVQTPGGIVWDGAFLRSDDDMLVITGTGADCTYRLEVAIGGNPRNDTRHSAYMALILHVLGFGDEQAIRERINEASRFVYPIHQTRSAA